LWVVNDDLVKIKAEELRLRRRDETVPTPKPEPVGVAGRVGAFFRGLFGTREPEPRPRETADLDLKRAKRLLKERIAAGEPLREEVLRREVATAALAALADRHVSSAENRS